MSHWRRSWRDEVGVRFLRLADEHRDAEHRLGRVEEPVGLARALALDPDILLFDEPTAGLDPITAAEIGKLIVDLKKRRKITSVVVTHDIHGAKTFSDRLTLMDKGSILAEGTFEDLQKSRDKFVVQFLKNSA